jgi:hypothetical protein
VKAKRNGTVSVLKKCPEAITMKKIILAVVVSTFGLSGAAAFACDGMKGHAKGEKGDQADSQSNSSAKKDTKGGTKSDQKS